MSLTVKKVRLESSGSRKDQTPFCKRTPGSPESSISTAISAQSAACPSFLGPWASGQAADQGTLAIAFYLNGRLLKRYSTLDIAGSPDNVRRSVVHYRVFEKVLGYRWSTGRQRFVVRTVDNRTLVFDPELGTQVTDKIAEKEQP